jgi:serine/threonine-protein kinase
MATIYLGKLLGPAGFSPAVAIKRLHPWLAREPSVAAMFSDEARLAAHVRHPNVVPVLDVVAMEDELLLVMEYVHGEALGHLIESARAAQEPIDRAVVAATVFGVLTGLHAAHEAKDERGKPLGLVHRDLSPQNVMVGIDGIARVSDFGIARAAGQLHTTREGALKGRLGYMAPEQARDGRLDRRTDVYAVGVMLWEMLTLKRLFSGVTEAAELLARLQSGPIEPPSRHAPGIPPEVDAIVMRALAADPTRRFPTARAMAAALERSTPLATTLEVAAWVQSAAGREIAERAERIAAICATASVRTTAAGGPPGQNAARQTRPARLPLAIMLVAAVPLTVFALGWRRHTPVARSNQTQAPLPVEQPAAALPLPHAVAATESTTPVRASIPSARPRTGERNRRSACDPPFWYDSSGIKRYRVDCPPR